MKNTPGSPMHAGNIRWTICGLLFFATTINYMDRQILGILAPQLETQFGWSEIEYGNLVTAFQAAYAIGLVSFGKIIDRLGTKSGYSIAIGLWSIAAMLHALATSVFGFGVARFALGLGEAGNFPAAIKAIAEWFPKHERALATGLFNAGSTIGAICAPLLVPWLTIYFGWRTSFVVLGLMGFIWLFFWKAIYEEPKNKRNLSSAEFSYITSDPVETSAKIPWRSLFGYRQTWAIIVGMSLSAPVWWFYLYWLPKFLHATYGLNLAHLGPPLVIIYSMTCVGSIGGGWLSSHLIGRGHSVNSSRKTTLFISALCAVPVIFAANASSVWIATLLVGLASAGHASWAANLYTLVSDLFPKKAIASVVGLASMAGSLAAILFAQSTGFILQATGSYWSLFLMCGFAYLTAFVIMHVLVPEIRPAVIQSTASL